MDRHALIMSEFHVYLPDSAPVHQFLYLSDKAYQIKEDKKKAAKEGKIYVG